MTVFHAGFHPGGQPVRVRFGIGARHDLSTDLAFVGATRALVLSTPEQADQGAELTKTLGHQAVGIYSRATMHTPVEITEDAMTQVRATRADCVIAIGGGSTIGLAKAIAWRSDLPQIVLPTTYAGSEATEVLGQTENGLKSTLTAQKVQPEVVVYDPELVATLPLAMTVTSALNAIAHSVEGLYAQNGNRLSSALALEGIRAFVRGLPHVVATPGDLAAREETLFGAWLCGTVLGQVGMALHHKLCHTLGGALNLPHAETHAIILPHATAYNEGAAATALRPLADLLGADHAAGGLHRLARDLGAPMALRDLGVAERDLDHVADLAVQNPYWNPRPIERPALRALLQAAWLGQPPIQEQQQ
ncbi:MAG: maleylacetate reductase [Qingshengfaniella sp.]